MHLYKPAKPLAKTLRFIAWPQVCFLAHFYLPALPSPSALTRRELPASCTAETILVHAFVTLQGHVPAMWAAYQTRSSSNFYFII